MSRPMWRRTASRRLVGSPKFAHSSPLLAQGLSASAACGYCAAMPHPQLLPALAQALDSRGYTELTPVQSAVIAEQAHGRDLIVSSRTGSGKTVAFGIAMAPALLESES